MTVALGPLRRALHRARASVRLRVTLLAAGAFAVTFFIAAAILLRSLENGLVDDLRESNSTALEAEAASLQATAALPPDVDVVRRTDGITVAQWLDPSSGRRITYLLPSGYAPGDAAAVILGEARPVQPSAALTLMASGDASWSDTVATTRVAGSGVLATFSPLADVRDAIARTTSLLWAVGPALVALVAGLAWMLAGRALRPVRLMTRRVSEIGSHSLHERVADPGSTDEIAELARTMNEMLGRLDAANESSRRLVSDASHELRTPIAVMRTELEVAARESEAGAGDWSATSGVLLGELDRLAAMVDDLLLLARGEERAAGSRPADVVDVVDLGHEAGARRYRADVEIAVVVDPEVTDATVDGDRAALVRALDHLVSNAARSAASRVEVRIETGAGAMVALHVDDDGPGIPVEQRSLVVQRFVRMDEGRSRDAGGAGLGLAVASEVAAVHDGRLEIDDSPLGGARVSILLPVGRARSATMGGDADHR
ncbi:sensor histidine kinase [Desertimonas flava]|uniref:sensor histidine kinase n=1 Tax=Desertimonas flava TaxID=2064846 RepID=UPI000E3464D5|nr:ATP-binding protein [Desertimonas flava]